LEIGEKVILNCKNEEHRKGYQCLRSGISAKISECQPLKLSKIYHPDAQNAALFLGSLNILCLCSFPQKKKFYEVLKIVTILE
jgi:hypothetical protein